MGLGRRTFAPGEVLTASNVMNFLMDQSVMSFAGTAARGSAIGTAVSEGMVSYLQDTNFVQVHDGTGWRSVGGVQVASGTAARDALLPSPVQGDKVFRSDLGYEQTYYGAHGTANPGGRASAGWYDNQRNMGLVSIIPPTINYSGGTATANSLGVISFTSVTSVSMNNVFSASYKHYKIVLTGIATTNGIGAYLRLRNAGTDRTIANNYFGGSGWRENGASLSWTGSGSSVIDLGRFGSSSAGTNSYSVELYNPFDVNKWTSYGWNSWSNDATSGFSINANGTYAYADTNDGFSIFPSSGNMTGSLQVFGFNS